MLNNYKAYLANLAVPLISVIILCLLVLQTIASFKLTFGPIERSPFLYPFLDYPMYKAPHYKGETVDEYLVVGILENSEEVPMRPEEMGLHFWLYRDGFVPALWRGDRARIKEYVRLYESRQHKKLIGLRLEVHPMMLSAEGVRPAPPQVMKKFELQFIKRGV